MQKYFNKRRNRKKEKQNLLKWSLLRSSERILRKKERQIETEKVSEGKGKYKKREERFYMSKDLFKYLSKEFLEPYCVSFCSDNIYLDAFLCQDGKILVTNCSFLSCEIQANIERSWSIFVVIIGRKTIPNPWIKRSWSNVWPDLSTFKSTP